MQLYKRPNSPYWWADYVDADGERKRQSTKTRSKREANEIALFWESEARRARIFGIAKSRKLSEVMDKFLVYSKQEKRSYDKDLERSGTLAAHLGDPLINEISGETVENYISIRRESISDSTINRELALLSAAINYCNKKLDWQLPNKVSGHKLKEPEGRVRWLTSEEATRLLDAAKQSRATYLTDFITLALHTGCRSGELLNLKWKDVHLDHKFFLLNKTKSGKRRSIPLNNTAAQMLIKRHREHLGDYVFSSITGKKLGSIKTGFNNACKAAEIKDFRIHDLRHTCAAWLAMLGVPMLTIRDLLGHSSITTTEIYAHLSPDNVRIGIEKLDVSENLPSEKPALAHSRHTTHVFELLDSPEAASLIGGS